MSDMELLRNLGVHHLLKRGFVANNQGGALQFQQLILLKLRKQAADRLACGADHLRNLRHE